MTVNTTFKGMQHLRRVECLLMWMIILHNKWILILFTKRIMDFFKREAKSVAQTRESWNLYSSTSSEHKNESPVKGTKWDECNDCDRKESCIHFTINGILLVEIIVSLSLIDYKQGGTSFFFYLFFFCYCFVYCKL